MPNDTAEKQREHRKRRHAKGQCEYCNSLAISLICCEKHLKKSIIHTKTKRKRRFERGECMACGRRLDEDADSGHKQCINCRERILTPIKQFQRRRHNAVISD